MGYARIIYNLIIKLENMTGLISFFLIPYLVYRSRGMELKDIIEKLFDKRSVLSFLYKPMQRKWEVERFTEILKGLRPKYILEIGTARGGTLFLWTRIAANDAVIISIDLPGGLFGGGYPLIKGLSYKFFARNKQKIFLIRGDSHSFRTLVKVKKILGRRKIDFLFIDGDHSYNGVKKDFKMYSSLVRRGGVIAFHDIVPGPSECVGGVPIFWREIKQSNKYEIIEIVENINQGGWGIGLLKIKE